MQNKYIIYLVIANIFWSLIPILVTRLFNEISILMIIFLRFFVSGIILFLLGIIFIAVNNRKITNEKMKISLKKLLKFTFRNNKKFYNLKYIYYFAVLGFFGIILQLIGFFLALKTTSIAFTMIGFQLSIIIVAFYEHGVKSEKLDLFKSLYLLILIFSIGIIIFVQIQQSPQGIYGVSITGFFYVVLFTICISFFQIGISKESYTKKELKFANINENYKITRMLIKLSLIFLTGTALMFPFIIIYHFLPFQGDLKLEIDQFFGEFTNIFQILFRWEILFIIILSTICPYLLLFMANVKWSPYNLTYSQWSSILTIIEPIGGLFFGVMLANENFPPEFLIIVLFLLTISILLRYAHEFNNKVNAIIILEKKQGLLKTLPLKLLKLDGVYCVDSLIGQYDLLLKIKTNSIKEIYNLIDTEIRKIEGIKNISILFINKINKLTI